MVHSVSTSIMYLYIRKEKIQFKNHSCSNNLNTNQKIINKSKITLNFLNIIYPIIIDMSNQKTKGGG